MQHVGITLIPAYSPEARGRSERAFRTLLDRLPNELALRRDHGEGGGQPQPGRAVSPHLQSTLWVPTPEAGLAFVLWIGTHLAEILCVYEEQVVAKDNTVHDHLQRLQIPQDPHRFHDAKGTGAGARLSEWNPGRVLWASDLARSRAVGHRLGQPRAVALESGSRCFTRPAARSSIVDHI